MYMLLLLQEYIQCHACVLNKFSIYYSYLYCVLYTGGLVAIMSERFVVISYIMNSNVNLPWTAQAIVFKLSFDLRGSFGLVATILGNTGNKIGTRGCIA